MAENVKDDLQRREAVLKILLDFESRYEEVLVYDPYFNLCGKDECVIYDKSTDHLLYRDDDHLSVEAGRMLAPTFTKWFNEKVWQE